jgi:hypothetical protein
MKKLILIVGVLFLLTGCIERRCYYCETIQRGEVINVEVYCGLTERDALKIEKDGTCMRANCPPRERKRTICYKQ